jgi:transcriptional regulator with XRE-family HTH domain
MGHGRRERPKHLAAKLLAIRKALRLSQSEMVARLQFKVTAPRISEYENGSHEPNLIVLLSYAKSVGISVDALIDDDVNLTLPESPLRVNYDESS